MNQPTNASRTRHHLRHRGLRRAGSAAIYSVVLDGENALCLTEPQLDAWWHSLSPEDKAEIYEQHLGDGVERCRFCGCTETRACVTDGQPCSWLDPNHTVCSAPACATRYHAEVYDQVFHGGPQKVVPTSIIHPSLDVFGPHTTAIFAETRRMLGIGDATPTREQIDHFLRTNEWLSLGDFESAQQQEVADATV